jgi:hypothetical protein
MKAILFILLLVFISAMALIIMIRVAGRRFTKKQGFPETRKRKEGAGEE